MVTLGPLDTRGTATERRRRIGRVAKLIVEVSSRDFVTAEALTHHGQ